ncbi:lamin-like protein [Selaginella moellendorffii]|nr:lamin-like protein [Selaginella moellendorffii]|eukprot:XP_002966681.2 lamin-like protein [Selaginella moellendorffii]
MKVLAIACCFVAFAILGAAARGTDYYVGDWTNGVNFTQWSQGRVFHAGDLLIFTVSTSDTILRVSQSVYNNCEWDLRFPKIFPAPWKTTWNETVVPWVGENYYVSSVQDNCKTGKKFMLSVQSPPVYTPREYTVGDDQGWAPGVNYSQWTANKNFYFGDSFRFLFNASEHSVVEVWEPGYQLCNESYFLPVLGLPTRQDDGRTLFKVVPPQGMHYYTSGNGNDCQSGLKMALEIKPQDEAFAPSPSPSGGVAGQESSAGYRTISFPLSLGSGAAIVALSLLAMA